MRGRRDEYRSPLLGWNTGGALGGEMLRKSQQPWQEQGQCWAGHVQLPASNRFKDLVGDVRRVLSLTSSFGG